MANTFKNAVTGSSSVGIGAIYTTPADTATVVHALYISNVDGTNDATVDIAVSGSAFFSGRTYLLKTVNVPADSTIIVEKPINLGAGDKLETQASANGDIDVFASILEMT